MIGLIRVFVCVLILALGASAGAQESSDSGWKARAITRGPSHHFFGYYGVSPWNKSGRRMVCLEAESQDHLPEPDEGALICLIDVWTGEQKYIAETFAWNLQQGAMLHWDPKNPETHILFNDREGDAVVGVSLDVNTGERETFSRAISEVSPDGNHALSLTYGRLQRMRKVVGYKGIADPNPDSNAPNNDGIFLLDLVAGESKLVISIADIYERMLKRNPELEGADVWFNHTVFNKDGSRFFFLARAKSKDKRIGRKNAMFSANTDGSEIWEVVPFGKKVSHFDWRNDSEIIVTALAKPGDDSLTHLLFKDRSTDPPRALAPDFLIGNGHCTFGPDANWLVTDPFVRDDNSRDLLLYNVETDQRVNIGTFQLGEYAHGDLRCDLHPRWRSTGDAICFDAITPDGTRQLHVAERVR
ncbi:MAG: hypothetical protein VCC01_04950 [Candidatus Hydrogenedentota bacterium]